MKLQWSSCFTTDRYGDERSSPDARSAFERDYDRIIFSAAFRRLQSKTQVFPLPERVFVHNRLTHSLEVVSVGRSLGMLVGEGLANLPELANDARAQDFYRNQLKTVVSAACLAHDLGNPAFGHSGEEAISKYFVERAEDKAFRQNFSPAQWEDLTHFEGNANALRMLTHQYQGRQAGGYQMTYTTLATLLKYPCESTARQKGAGKHRSKYGFFQSELEVFEAVQTRFGLLCDSASPRAYFRHPFVYLVEAADDICYSIIDFEDAHRLGILSYAEVENAFLALLHSEPQNDEKRVKDNLHKLAQDPNEAVAYLRAKCINLLVHRCAQYYVEQQQAFLSGQFSSSLLEALSGLRKPLEHIARQSVSRIYNHESVVKIELAGFKIMSGLIEDFVEAALLPKEERQSPHRKILALMPSQFQICEADSPYHKVMHIIDHISGMTDHYALELYRNLRGISVPGV